MKKSIILFIIVGLLGCCAYEVYWIEKQDKIERQQALVVLQAQNLRYDKLIKGLVLKIESKVAEIEKSPLGKLGDHYFEQDATPNALRSRLETVLIVREGQDSIDEISVCALDNLFQLCLLEAMIHRIPAGVSGLSAWIHVQAEPSIEEAEIAWSRFKLLRTPAKNELEKIEELTYADVASK